MTDIADRAADLPPRDPSKPDTEQGLFQKFIVTRTDGSSGPGGKHEGCEYFVLDIDHDPLHKPALQAYADACESTHPQLAADMRVRYRLTAGGTTAPEPDAELYAAQERILRRRARAFGIARDVADGYAARRGEGGQTATYRQLVNLLLSEPEVVTAIADWRQAAREAVDAADKAPIPAGYSAEERPRATLARHEALAVRCTLSAHHEEWWRLHRELEQSKRELHQLMADGLAARRRAAGRLQSDAASAAAVDALREAEMPQAVPGRCRDVAEQLRAAYDPPSRMTERWTLGQVADLLEQIADAWNRRPEAGMNLSQGKPAAVYATPVLLETTALWAGAQTARTDGAVHFSAEAWAKFMKCLGEEPPLEILTSPGVSAPAPVVHQRCAERGCQEAKICPSGKCAMGPGEQA